MDQRKNGYVKHYLTANNFQTLPHIRIQNRISPLTPADVGGRAV
jgi:hypothetical protein